MSPRQGLDSVFCDGFLDIGSVFFWFGCRGGIRGHASPGEYGLGDGDVWLVSDFKSMVCLNTQQAGD